MITIIRNNYSKGEFRSTEIIGTFVNYAEAEVFLHNEVMFGGKYTQIAPQGYERLNPEGKRFEHIIITGSNTRERDINGRWVCSK